MEDSNREILKQLNDSESWFKAVKVAEVWAKENTSETVIESLEGSTTAESGDMICRGPDGETWVQDADKFDLKYRQLDEAPDSDGFRKHVPIPANSQVMAAKVGRQFEVNTSRGVLTGQANDYLLKGIKDEKTEFPDSVWVVAEAIFATTYKPI